MLCTGLSQDLICIWVDGLGIGFADRGEGSGWGLRVMVQGSWSGFGVQVEDTYMELRSQQIAPP